ncbi:MAG: hypothetical protein AAGD01_14515 [Acidobacteriota bacterium]
MHLFLELATLAAFLLLLGHALFHRGGEGLWFFGALFYLGVVRENFVQLVRYLYDFAPLTLSLGIAPLIAAIIWGLSLYVALDCAEILTGRTFWSHRLPSLSLLAAVGLFMVLLPGFYEPFLEAVGMAKWEEGTRRSFGVPWIALVGYPTLTLPFLVAWSWAARQPGSTRPSPPRRRLARLALALTPLALLHAWGLQALKSVLGW